MEDVLDTHTESTIKSKTSKRFELDLAWPSADQYTSSIQGFEQTTEAIKDLLRTQHVDSASNKTGIASLASGGVSRPIKDDIFKQGWVPREYSYTRLKTAYDPQHNPDKVGKVEFRILHLSRGDPDDPLHGTLETTTVREKADYEAVSYTWADGKGDARRRRPLFLGPDCDRLSITANCEAALRSLRSRHEARALWVDAICIDQNSEEDKASQISIMNYIYSYASSVLIFLSCTSPEINSLLHAIEIGEDPTTVDNPSPRERAQMELIFSDPYFHRVWIVQEIALAKDIWIYTPQTKLQWKGFRLHGKAPLDSAVPTWIQQCRATQNRSVSHLSDWLFSGISLLASRPEDKVFGFFGIVPDLTLMGLTADYKFSIEQVYTGIVSFLILKTQCLRQVLLHASCGDSIDHTLHLDLPSWVPDFRRRYMAESSTSESSSITTPPNYQYQQLRVLKSSGSLVVHGFRLVISDRVFHKWGPRSFKGTLGNYDKIALEFERDFIRNRDILFVPLTLGDEGSVHVLHLRGLGKPACYTFLGCCSISFFVKERFSPRHDGGAPLETSLVQNVALTYPGNSLDFDLYPLTEKDFENLLILTSLDQSMQRVSHWGRGYMWDVHAPLVTVSSILYRDYLDPPTSLEQQQLLDHFNYAWGSPQFWCQLQTYALYAKLSETQILAFNNKRAMWTRRHEATRAAMLELFTRLQSRNLITRLTGGSLPVETLRNTVVKNVSAMEDATYELVDTLGSLQVQWPSVEVQPYTTCIRDGLFGSQVYLEKDAWEYHFKSLRHLVQKDNLIAEKLLQRPSATMEQMVTGLIGDWRPVEDFLRSVSAVCKATETQKSALMTRGYLEGLLVNMPYWASSGILKGFEEVVFII